VGAVECHRRTSRPGSSRQASSRTYNGSELLTLVKPGASNPALPAEHPFINPLNVPYWTSTFVPASTTALVAVDMGTGGLTFTLTTTSGTAPYWCVRGPL